MMIKMRYNNPLTALGYDYKRLEEGVISHGNILSLIEADKRELTDLFHPAEGRFPGQIDYERYSSAFSEIDNAPIGSLDSWLNDIMDAAKPKRRWAEIIRKRLKMRNVLAAVASAALGAMTALYAVSGVQDSQEKMQESAEQPIEAPAYIAEHLPEPEEFLSWPVDRSVDRWNDITSAYGPRSKGNGKKGLHKAIDIGLPPGTPILAAAGGTVDFACEHKKDRCKGAGTSLSIDHGNLLTSYFHLTRLEDGITKGTKVKKGQVIGYSGSTGVSRGPHLHFQVYQERKRNSFNPFCYYPDDLLEELRLRKHGKKIYGDRGIDSSHPKLAEECEGKPGIYAQK